MDTSKFSQVAPKLRGGDILFFGGTGFLSDTIKLFSHSNLTHSVMVLDPKLALQGTSQSQLNDIESTILNGVSGPQVNDLLRRMAAYDAGGSAWVAYLSEEFRSSLNWDAMWRYALGRVGHDHYSTIELVEYVVRDIPIAQDIPLLYVGDAHRNVCAEFLTECFQAGGGLPGVNPFVTNPQKLGEMRIYKGYEQIAGKPAKIKGFNTV